MAFNPFHSFRKHQKVIFAVLTILCMFVFVLQFGRGDFFERIGGIFGAGKARGEYVATVNGSKVYTGELDGPRGLRVQRVMVNNFILSLMSGSVRAVADDPRGSNDKLDPRTKQVLNDIRNRGSQGQQALTIMFQDLKNVEDLKAEFKGKEGKEGELLFLNELAGAINIQETLLFFNRGSYFGGGSSLEDLLDFKLWEHQADKLGIVLTEDAVRLLLKRDTGGRDVLPEGSFRSSEKYKTMMANFTKTYGTVNESQIIDGLAAEYRVILAQQALLGQAVNYRGAGGIFAPRPDYSPVTITPGQFLQYFREQRTTVKAALLPIRVDDFLKDVTAEPSEDDLHNLWEKYKDTLPSPAQAYPGFKEPRSVRVQYLSVSAKEEFYQELAKKLYVPGPAMVDVNLVLARQVAAGFGAFPGGGGAGAWAMTAGTPLSSDYVLQEYNKYTEQHRLGIGMGNNVGPEIYEPSYDAASALGYILSGVAQGNPAAAPASLTNTNRAHAMGQARAVGAAILTGTSPTPGLPVFLQLTTDYAQPLDKVGSEITTKARENVAKQLVSINLGLFLKEVNDRRATPAKAKEYIEKAVKDYAFHLETMQTAKDERSLPDDPALKDLREAFTKRRSPITSPVEFASEITRPMGVYTLFTASPNQQMIPNAVILPDEQIFIYWLVEDNPAKMRSYSAAKAEVLAAWKRMQARKLAIKAAKAVEAKAQSQTWPTESANRQDAVLAFLDSQKYGKAFVLSNIARQIPKLSANAQINREYEPYKPPETDIKYPPESFTDQVLALQKPGEATWLGDRPVTTLFVTVLLDRATPTYADFKDAYEKSLSDSLWMNYAQQEKQTFATKFIENMREQAAPDATKNGKWNLPPGLRRARSSPDSGNEE